MGTIIEFKVFVKRLILIIATTVQRQSKRDTLKNNTQYNSILCEYIQRVLKRSRDKNLQGCEFFVMPKEVFVSIIVFNLFSALQLNFL